MKLKTFYIISTPINGQMAEVSPSAVEALRKCSVVIVEDFLAGKKILDLLKVDITQKTILELNEHTESQNSGKIFEQIRECENSALISDAGTPIFADPGQRLIQLLIQHHINLVHIPSIASVLSALVLCGFDIRSFYFAGFPPRESPQRAVFFQHLAKHHETTILLDAPYRFNKLIIELSEVFPLSQNLCIMFGIGTPEQFIFRGSLESAILYYRERIHKKDPFVIVLDTNKEHKFKARKPDYKNNHHNKPPDSKTHRGDRPQGYRIRRVDKSKDTKK